MSLIIGGYASASSALARLSKTDERKDPSQMRVLFEEMKRRLRCFQNQKLNKTQLWLVKLPRDARISLTSETLFPCISREWFLSVPPVPSLFFKSCKSPCNSAPTRPTCEITVTSLPALPVLCSWILGLRGVFGADWWVSSWHLHLCRNLPQMLQRLPPAVV